MAPDDETLDLVQLRKQTWTKVYDLHIVMFTTIDSSGQLSSRPMTLQEESSENTVWFFSASDSDVDQAIQRQPDVVISSMDTRESFYFCASGRAQVVTDPEAIDRLWNVMVSAWFPQGRDDPTVVLIKVVLHSAEVWNDDTSKMVQFFTMVHAAVSGSPPTAMGEHVQLLSK